MTWIISFSLVTWPEDGIMVLEQDQVLNNRYKIIKLLGQGGFGEVYQAWDMRLEGCCAVKRNLQPALEVRRQFEQEARMLFKLRHPNLPRVQDYFTGVEEEQYLVMDFIDGEDLRSYLKRLGPPLVEQALAWLEQVCDALTYLHTRQPPVLHRDIKPANIIITPESQAMLVDFGIAKSDPQMRTLSGARAWTPGFAPPEQYGQGRTDAQSDVYSLGATAYALLTGEAPPDAMDIAAGDKEPARPAHEVNPVVPLPVSQAIEQAMQLSRAKRTRTAAEFRQSLKIPPVQVPPPPVEGATIIEPPASPEINSPEPQPEEPPPLPGLATSEPQPEALPQTTGISLTETRVDETPGFPEPGIGLPQPEAMPARKRLSPRWIMGGLLVVVVVAAIGSLAWWFIRDLQGRAETANATTLKTALAFELQVSQTVAAMPSPLPTREPVPTKAPEPTAPVFQGELKVAILAPLSGPVPTYGVSTRDGALMAIDEWNARGGVLGMKIVPIVEDSQCTPDPAVDAANKVIDQDKVHYIIGEVCSLASIPISEIANQKSVVQLSPTSTNPSVVRFEDGTVKPFTFVACFNDDIQGNVMAQFAANDLNAKTAFILFDQANDYVKGLAEAFEINFTEAGGTIVGKETYTATDTDFSAILAKVAEAGPDVVVLPDYYNVVNLVTRQAKEKGITAPFIGGDGWDSPDLDTQAAAGSYFTNHYSPSEQREIVQNFVARYSETFKDDQGNPRLPDALAALAYDATNMLLEAIRDAGRDDSARVRDVLAARKFEVVSGEVTFDAFHTPIKPVFINAVKESGIEFYKRVDPAPSSESAADLHEPTRESPEAPACIEIGQTWTSPIDGMTLVCVPAGEFSMGANNGDNDEKPVHTVNLDAFWIDQTEVTNGMYGQFIAETGYQNVGTSASAPADRPVTRVSWNDAAAYCNWAQRQLPSEAQWEKTARGTDGRTYPWGNENPDCKRANSFNSMLQRSCENAVTAVGSYPSGASPYGALDMAGNIWEWVADWYQADYYSRAPGSNPGGPADGNTRVMRGGVWYSNWLELRTSDRSNFVPTRHDNGFGFRCAVRENH